MYVRRIEFDDLRSFMGKASADFLYPGRRHKDAFETIGEWPPRLPNVNVLLGINGSGKSTVLEGIALGLLSPVIGSSGYRPYCLIRRSNRGTVKSAAIDVSLVLHPQDTGGSEDDTQAPVLRTVIERRGDIEFVRNSEPSGALWDGMFDDSSPAFFIVGYGATRRVEALSAGDLATRRKSRLLRYERVASLFEDHFSLTPLNAWLPEWKTRNPGRHTQVVHLINRLLPQGVKFTGELDGGEYAFRHGTVSVPFSALSDGYQAYIGWIGDLLYHLCMGAPSGAKLVDSRGVVLVDEIDLHIHPSWQRTLIPTLARTLKKLQFIFTTHSPLVAGTLQRANLYFVERRRGHPVLARPEEETFGQTADQILQSEMFGLDSTRDPEFRDRLLALSRQASDGEEGAALRFMREAALGSAGAVADEMPPPPDWLRNLKRRQSASDD